MPARTAPILITKERYGNRQPETDRRNFELFNDPNGAAGQRAYLEQLALADQGRAGPLMDRGQGMADFAQSQQARQQEDLYAEQLRQQAYGGNALNARGNPAIAQLEAGMTDSINNMNSIAAGAGGYGLAAAKRGAAWGAADLGIQSQQQARVLGAQAQAFGRDQYGAFSEAMRGQDLATRGAMQQDALRAAQLEDEQRARNDAMSQFYLSEQDRIRRGQSQANQAFEAQDAASKFGQSNMAASARAYDQQASDRMTGAAASAVGSGLASVARIGAESERKNKNPYDTEPY